MRLARIGFYLLLSAIAVAAVAGGVAASRRKTPVVDVGDSCWAASAG